jgi:hypothetical protein
MKTLSLIEKIALIWTIPIAIAILVIALIVSVLKYSLAIFLKYTGTGSALSFVFMKIKSSYVTKKFNQFKQEDILMNHFDIRN